MSSVIYLLNVMTLGKILSWYNKEILLVETSDQLRFELNRTRHFLLG